MGACGLGPELPESCNRVFKVPTITVLFKKAIIIIGPEKVEALLHRKKAARFHFCPSVWVL